MKIIAIVGSLRKESYNMQLAKTIQERYKERMDVDIADINLSLYNQDIENNPPREVIAFKEKVKNAQGVVIITPEHNGSIPSVLKNAIDWASRVDRVFIGKPVMIAGVTPGMLGTVKAQLHLREIMAGAGIEAEVLPPAGNEVFINFAEQKFDQSKGRLVEENTLKFLDSVVDKFCELFVLDGTKKEPEL